MPDAFPNTLPSDAPLPAHIESSVRSIAELHLRHHERTTLPQRALSRLTDAIGRPVTLALLTLAVAIWIGSNLLIIHNGGKPWDEPPFYWLEGAASVGALYTTVLILTVQRHDDRLARQREQLTLELAILADQKSAKMIELLEKIRRDSPHLADHDDAEALAMTRPADPRSMLDALDGTEKPGARQG